MTFCVKLGRPKPNLYSEFKNSFKIQLQFQGINSGLNWASAKPWWPETTHKTDFGLMEENLEVRCNTLS